MAHEYRDPARAVEVKRKRNDKEEVFLQGANPFAPIVELALLLTCTGMCVSEALGLRWEHCDLETGVLRIFGQKTRSFRYLPLVGDPKATSPLAPSSFS
ncbi:MAG: hypothetical protein RL885_23250 [Planctomycetota bacterium]